MITNNYTYNNDYIYWGLCILRSYVNLSHDKNICTKRSLFPETREIVKLDPLREIHLF